MFFTSVIIIAFFCFAFYLIWDQFLKKDSRLSTGLHVLRKKMRELEDLSAEVDHQMQAYKAEFSSQVKELKQSTQIMASQIPQASALARALEEHLKALKPFIEAPQPAEKTVKNVKSPQNPAVQSLPVKSEPPKNLSAQDKKVHFQFGESPFIDPGP